MGNKTKRLLREAGKAVGALQKVEEHRKMKDSKPLKPNRPYICIYFKCCGVYQRIYRQPDRDKYVGWCPRCLGKVTVKVGPKGTTERIFEAH